MVNFWYSLVKSFKASAIGWDTPHWITLLGPNRKCMRPIIFRSISVKNATLNNIPTMEIIKSRV